MTTTDLPADPFMTAVQMTDYSNDESYAKTADPAGTPSRARLLREAAMGR